MNKFVKNLKYFLSFKGITQRSIAETIGVTESAISMWKKGQIPGKNNRKRFARYLAGTFDIPYSDFEDGQALITKDFSKIINKILANRQTNPYIENKDSPSLQGTPGRGETRIAKEEITRRSARYDKFIRQLIYLYNKQKGLEDSALFQDIPEASLSILIDYLRLINFDFEYLIKMNESLRIIRRYPTHASPEMDKKLDKNSRRNPKLDQE